MPVELFQRRQILMRVESTEGTEAVPVGATDSLLTFEGSVQVESDKLERVMDLSYFSANPFVLVNRRVTMSFGIEMLGAAAAGSAAPIGALLRICGLSETLVASTSATYRPRTTGTDSATFHFNHAGVLFKAIGAKATIEWEMMVDGYCKGQVTVTGLIAISDIPAAVAPVTTTLTAFRTPPAIDAANWVVTLNAVALECTKITLNHGADIQIHHHSEGRVARMMDRKPSGVITCYLPTLGTLNPWALAANHTQVALSSAINGGATRNIGLTAALIQLEEPRTVELNRGMGLEIPFVPLPTGAGNDEYAWAFT